MKEMSPESKISLHQHREGVYNERNNSFLLAQSIFFAAFFLVRQQNTIEATIFSFALVILGVVFSILWLSINIKAFIKLGRIQEDLAKSYEEFSQSGLKVVINKQTGIMIPVCLLVFWLLILVFILVKAVVALHIQSL